ncbi:MAG: DUF167 domain-containing protein [Pseudomonadota bacterium]
MLNIKEKINGITIECRITPRAKRTEIKGEREGVLLVSVTAPPTEGKANQALIKLLSKILRVPKSRISILSGQTGRNKVVFVQGVSQLEVHSALRL